MDPESEEFWPCVQDPPILNAIDIGKRLVGTGSFPPWFFELTLEGKAELVQTTHGFLVGALAECDRMMAELGAEHNAAVFFWAVGRPAQN